MTYNISRRKADSFICSLKLENPGSCGPPGFSIPMLKKRKTRSWWLRVFRFFELMEHLIIFYVFNYNLLRLRSQIIISCDKIEHMCYNMYVASPTRHRREVNFIGNRYIIFNLCHSEYSSQLYKQMAGQRTGKRRPA